MTTNIIQLFGWRDEEMFDVLMNLSNGVIKDGIHELMVKYAVAITKPVMTPNKMTGQDVHYFYDTNSNKKRKPPLIKSIEDDTTMDYILFNLWDFMKIINEDHKLNLKIAILHLRLYVYFDYIVTHEVYHPGSSDFRFPSDLIKNVNFDPNPGIFTLIDATSESDEERYMGTPPLSPESPRYCDKCGIDY